MNNNTMVYSIYDISSKTGKFYNACKLRARVLVTVQGPGTHFHKQHDTFLAAI